MDVLIGMKLRDVLDELQPAAPVKLGLRSGYYYCGLLPDDWATMIEVEHRRDMRYICKELDRLERNMLTFSDSWNKRLIVDIDAARHPKEPKVPGETEVDIVNAIRKNANDRSTAWDSMINRIANFTAELHKPPYLDRKVTEIYDSIDPDEPEGTVCILIDGIKTGKYYSSDDYKRHNEKPVKSD